MATRKESPDVKATGSRAAVPTKAAKAAVKKRSRPALKIPKSFGACADLLYTTRDERLAEKKKVDEIEADEKALRTYLIEQLPKGDLGGAQGKLARATVVTTDVPSIQDHDKLMAAIKKAPKKWGVLLKTTVDLDVLKEMLENGGVKALPPGVGVFTVKKISLNKV